MSIEKPTFESDSQQGLSFLKSRLDEKLGSGMTIDELVECLLADQRVRFERGQSIGSEDYFDLFPDIAQSESYSIDLIYSEFLLRIQYGEPQSQSDYRTRFTDQWPALEKQFQVYDALKDSHLAEVDYQSASLNQWTDPVTHSATSNPGRDLPPSIDLPRYQQYLSADRFRVEEVLDRGPLQSF